MIIGGPTASGKSALAVDLARALDGVVINADSMQVYRELRVLTARPDPATMAAVPHRLYGIWPARDAGSVALWLDLARQALAEARDQGRWPVVVGGTGLYLRALMQGLAPVPGVPEAVVAEGRRLWDAEGGPAFRERLAALDPDAAARLAPGDRQRLVRAWAVVTATGRPLGAWQAETPGPPPGSRFDVHVLMPPREALYPVCDGRFAAMVAQGALDEVRALAELPPDLPAAKAVGVPELRRHLAGEWDLETAIAAGARATRRYAKRQMTWFRHQMPGATLWPEQYSESLSAQILSKIC